MREFILSKSPTLLLSGMALGVDQWAVELAIGAGIPFHAYVPFVGQEDSWPMSQRVYYRQLLKAAGQVIHVSNPPYAAWKMQKRNEAIVNACEHLLAVFDGSEGGTANCVAYARKVGRNITIINPKEVK